MPRSESTGSPTKSTNSKYKNGLITRKKGQCPKNSQSVKANPHHTASASAAAIKTMCDGFMEANG